MFFFKLYIFYIYYKETWTNVFFNFYFLHNVREEYEWMFLFLILFIYIY